MAGSVTRLATFHQFGKKLKVFGQFVWIAYLVFGKLLYQLWHFYATGQIFIFVNGQRLKGNNAIWSHWWQVYLLTLSSDTKWNPTQEL